MPATAPSPPTTTLITASHTPTALVPPFHEGDWVGAGSSPRNRARRPTERCWSQLSYGSVRRDALRWRSVGGGGIARLLRARGRGPDWDGEARGDGRDHGPKSAIRLSAKGVSMD